MSAMVGKTHGEIQADHDDWARSQQRTTRCAVPSCDWSFTGTGDECSEAFTAHREAEHAHLTTNGHKAQEPKQEATMDEKTCKVEGCDRPVSARMGPYAKVCIEHRATIAVGGRKTSGAKPTSEKRSPKRVAATNGHVEARDRIVVLHALVEAEQQIVNKRVELHQAEQQFEALAQEFARTIGAANA